MNKDQSLKNILVMSETINDSYKQLKIDNWSNLLNITTVEAIKVIPISYYNYIALIIYNVPLLFIVLIHSYMKGVFWST